MEKHSYGKGQSCSRCGALAMELYGRQRVCAACAGMEGPVEAAPVAADLAEGEAPADEKPVEEEPGDEEEPARPVRSGRKKKAGDEEAA